MRITMNDIKKKIKDNGLEGKVHARDLALGEKSPEILNKIVDNKIGYMNAKTDAERGMYSAETKALRAAQGYQLSDDGSRDVTNEVLHGSGSNTPGQTTAAVIKMVEENRLKRKAQEAGAASAAASNRAFENYKTTLAAAQKKAEEDVLGKMASLTGGYGSSSAAAAAASAGADYSKLLADKELELAETERQNALAAEQTEYQRKTASEQTDYQRKLEKAKLAAALGDYSLYEEMGINLDALRANEKAAADAAAAEKEQSDYEQLLAAAELAAKYGDTSGLRALGIDTSRYDAKYAADAAQTGTAKSAGTAASGSTKKSTADVTDPSAALAEAGAKTFNQAYAMLLGMGYSTADAKTMAQNYLAEIADAEEEDGDTGANEGDAPFAQTGKTGGKTRPASALKAYAADVADARKSSMTTARDLLATWMNEGAVTAEEAVMLAKQSSSGLADALLRMLVANAQITADEANAMAQKYRIE